MEDSTVSIDAPTTVATKGYVDENASSLPEGGEIGATLIMTSQGPMWNNFLTWAGSTRTIFECDQIGGTVFDTGSGTICRYPRATIPSGWSQAAYWQRYNSSVWGGDACGNHKSTGPDTFSNQAANALTYNLSLSSYWPNPCATHPEWWWVAFTGYDGHPVVADSLTTSNNRAEIGLY